MIWNDAYMWEATVIAIERDKPKDRVLVASAQLKVLS